jgi:signal transduction histidine kinase
MLLEIQFDHKLVAQLFDLQPDAVVWYSPVRSKGKIVDFEYRYCNSAACRLFGVPAAEVVGTPVKECSFLDPLTRELIFEQCLTVYNNEKPLEFTYFSPVFNSYLNVQRSKALDGILSITRDHTHQVKAEQDKERQRNLLRTIANASPTCIVLCEAIRDNQNAIDDFKFLMVNEKALDDFGLSKEKIESTTFARLKPEIQSNGLLDILRSTVETGVSFKDEIYLETFGGWSLLTATKVEDERILVISLDINETRKDKIALQEQAEWFNNILSHSPSGIIALESIRDSLGEIVDFEVRLANLAGKVMTTLPVNPIGKRLLDVLPQMKSNGYFDIHKKVVETGESFSGELSFHAGKMDRWFQVSLVKLNDGLISNFMDISDIKYFEERIQDQAANLQSILDASLNGIFACEAVKDEEDRITNFRFVKINAAFTSILHLEEKDVIGRLYSDVFPGTHKTDLLSIYESVVETGKPVQREQYYQDASIEGWFLLSISKWGDDGIVQTFYDYTNLKELQQQLELTIQGLKRSNERLTEFSHVASHDLNEPLRKVITFSKLLNDRYGSTMEAVAKDYLDRIEKTAIRMQVLLENLLIYSRVTKQINSFENVSLNSVVQDVISDLETRISQRNAVINVGKLPNITGEKTQLQQLFQNLISNGLKFQPADRQPVITVRHTRTGTLPEDDRNNKSRIFHEIEITDNGIGFDPSEREKIFQLFHRLHARHEYEGTGIGLAIVQRAMENHHGFIRAESEEGRGATFRLFFPR